jgi:hypothetical protein
MKNTIKYYSFIYGSGFVRLWKSIYSDKLTLQPIGSRDWEVDTFVKPQEKLIDSADDLDYVHGSMEELLAGKTCVIRDRRYVVEEVGEVNVYTSRDEGAVGVTMKSYKIVENPPFKSVKVLEGRLVFLSRTGSGNSRVKLFKK